DEMAEAVTARPWSADQLAHAFLPAKTFQPAPVVARERVIVPANRPAHLGVALVDTSGGVMRRRDAAPGPVLQASLRPQFVGDDADAVAGLTFQLHQVQFRHAAFGPQVRWKLSAGDRGAVQVERQALDAAGAKIPARDNGFGTNKPQDFGHASPPIDRVRGERIRSARRKQVARAPRTSAIWASGSGPAYFAGGR